MTLPADLLADCDSGKVATAVVESLLAAPLSHCTHTSRADAARLYSRHDLAKGESLLAQGEPWRHALLIERGLLRLYFVRRDGREFNKNFYADGALVCPLTPAMWGEPSLFAIAALAPSVVWRADAAHWRRLLDEHGAWQPLQRELLARLVTHKLQREHDLLMLDGRARYLAFCRRQPLLAERVPLAHLASYLGLTDVSLSRIRRNLARAEHL